MLGAPNTEIERRGIRSRYRNRAPGASRGGEGGVSYVLSRFEGNIYMRN